MKEKLQEYALIAEIIGGIGIIASLIFVGFQLEQNTLSTELNAYENFRQDYVELQSTSLQIRNLHQYSVNHIQGRI